GPDRAGEDLPRRLPDRPAGSALREDAGVAAREGVPGRAALLPAERPGEAGNLQGPLPRRPEEAPPRPGGGRRRQAGRRAGLPRQRDEGVPHPAEAGRQAAGGRGGRAVVEGGARAAGREAAREARVNGAKEVGATGIEPVTPRV